MLKPLKKQQQVKEMDTCFVKWLAEFCPRVSSFRIRKFDEGASVESFRKVLFPPIVKHT